MIGRYTRCSADSVRVPGLGFVLVSVVVAPLSPLLADALESLALTTPTDTGAELLVAPLET